MLEGIKKCIKNFELEGCDGTLGGRKPLLDSNALLFSISNKCNLAASSANLEDKYSLSFSAHLFYKAITNFDREFMKGFHIDC